MSSEKVELVGTPAELTLEVIFARYIAHAKKTGMTVEQVEATKSVFYGGAYAVLQVFDQLTTQILRMEEQLYDLEINGLGEGDVEFDKAMEYADKAAGTLQGAMTDLMEDVCKVLEVENDSTVCRDIKEIHAEQEAAAPSIGADFDLSEWTPDGGAN